MPIKIRKTKQDCDQYVTKTDLEALEYDLNTRDPQVIYKTSARVKVLLFWTFVIAVFGFGWRLYDYHTAQHNLWMANQVVAYKQALHDFDQCIVTGTNTAITESTTTKTDDGFTWNYLVAVYVPVTVTTTRNSADNCFAGHLQGNEFANYINQINNQ